MSKLYKIVDANINRASEGLRVIEDIVRFYFEDRELTDEIRKFRHRLRKNFPDIEENLIISREPETDPGRVISASSETDRKDSLKQLVLSNFKRIEEALRVIEENLKLLGQYNKSKQLENLRFEIYTIEKKYIGRLRKKLPEGIYGITAEKFSSGRSNIEVVKEMIEGGVKIIQYREKRSVNKSFGEICRECAEIRRITADSDTLFIVNDYVDIAMMVDADGVHIGQDDHPVSEVRNLVGNRMIGLSTHSPEQAREALTLDIDYIGVGPLYGTNIKETPMEPVGLEYLEYVAKNINIPFVAIGGIKEHNIKEVSDRGATTICLVSEIVGADDIAMKVKNLRKIINN